MKYRLILIAGLVILVVAACGGDTQTAGPGNEEPGAAQGAAAETAGDPAPDPGILSREIAAAAFEEFQLMSSTALFLLFEAREADATSVSNEDGSLTLAWEDLSSDLNRGRFTITLRDYRIPPESPFGALSVGYVFNGTYRYDTRSLRDASMQADLDLSHEEAAAYPVRSIRMDVTGLDLSPGALPTGQVFVDGNAFDLSDLSEG